jgi:GNAT superfamily N-acetyltransferase
MHIQVQTWDDISKEQLAQYWYETRQAEGVVSESTSMEGFNNFMRWVLERENSVPIVAYVDDEVVGWLAFFSFVPKIGTIGRWHPVVKPGPLRTQIATELLRATITHAKAQGFDRLEAELTEITAHTESRAEMYQRWLEAQKFYLATEEARLELKLTDDLLPPVRVPSDFELVSLDVYTNEELQGPFFEMFDNSIDRFWLDQTVEQRLDTFNFWFNRERPIIEKGTCVLVKGAGIVGITVVRPVQDVGMLGPIAVLSQYRRQGLGRGLLAFSMRGTVASGFSTMQLEFDITNEPAFALYRSLGFEHVHGLRIFALAL